MNWLVTSGRTAIATLMGTAPFLTAGIVTIDPAKAAQEVAPPQISYTCRFDNGPRAGQSVTYDGISGEPIAVGVPCSDGQGSTGLVVPDQSVQLPAAPVQPPLAPRRRDITFICRFDDGPRSGQTQSYAGVTGMQPLPVGAPCTDGQGSTGVAIAESPPPPPAPPPAPTRSFSCQFENGPRAGQTQSYVGVTGIQPMQVGSECTDGQGSSGVAVPDVALSPPAQMPPPPTPVPVASPTPPAPPPDVAPPPPVPPALPSEPSLPAPASGPHTHGVPGAAVGAPVRGLSGATWADPKNSGIVTGYTYKGRYHSGAPRGYDPTTATVLSDSPRAIRHAPEVPVTAIVGTAVRGERGPVWADFNNDGVADGYVEDGRYFPGVPPGFVSGADSTPQTSPPPAPGAFVPPPVISSGERG